MNIPYVKRYDKDGNLINPIKEGYYSLYPNRRNRKLSLKRAAKRRIKGGSK